MSFGMNKSKQRSSQEQGVTRQTRGFLSDRIPTQYETFRTRANQAYADPGGLEFESTVNRLLPQGRYGQSLGADQGISQLGRDTFGFASGNRAQRGFNTPYNLEGVLGDAMRMASGQLVPEANAFALQRAQMMPALRQAQFGYGSSILDMISKLVSGGTGKAASDSFGFQAAMPGAGSGGAGAGGGAGAASSGATALSDKRLKSNIILLGQHPLGIGWYEYDIQGRREQGVMAQEVLEVMPEAVSTGADGFYRVNYNLVGRVE